MILYTKYEKADSNKLMKCQCKNLTEDWKNLLNLLQKFEDVFDGTLSTCETD